MRQDTFQAVVIAAIVLPLLLAGCGGSGVSNSGHAIGYIYADVEADAAQAAGRMYLLSSPSADPTLEPVGGANLILEEADRTTRTNADGRYAFYDVPAGRYRLEAHHSGYAPRQWEIVVQAGYTTFGDALVRRNDPLPIYDDRRWSWDSDDGWTPTPQPSPTPSPPAPTPPPTDDTTDDDGGISIFRTDD